MPTLKQLINRYIYIISFMLTVFSIMMVSYVEIIITRNRTYEDALLTLSQIEQIMKDNEEKLNQEIEEYRKTCILNTKVISRLIEDNSDLLYDVDELKVLAQHLEIDEIHFFDETGCIISGTHPAYFGYTMDSGEQINFFKPMLTDKSLEMVQEVTANTAASELMQYSACWSKNGKYIIQVGMKPVNVDKATEHNELSYIFSLFRVNPNISYYAIDSTTGEIIGATTAETVGLDCSEVGFSYTDIENSEEFSHVNVNGTNSYCVFKKINSTYIAYVMPSVYLYREIPTIVGILLLCMLIIAFGLVTSFNEYMRIHVVEKIRTVNDQLISITNGNLNQIVDVRNIHEFSELSTHINRMVQNLSSSNAKLTYIFGKNNFFVGTYEYAENSDYVQFSEYISTLFSLDDDTIRDLSLHPDRFKNFIKSLERNAVPNENNVYKVENKFIRVDEITDNNYVLGVVMDVTNDVAKRQKLEFEIHLDTLTGLFNQFGLEDTMSKLFASPERLGHYAIITIMTDNLIQINQAHGRSNGDRYIQNIANLITDFGIKESIAARNGGGDFVLFLYGYENEHELMKTLNILSYLQHNSVAHLDNGLEIPIQFSFGYSIYNSSSTLSCEQLIKNSNDKNFDYISV